MNLSIFNQMELYLVKNRKENCHHDHIPFNLKGNGNIIFSVQLQEVERITSLGIMGTQLRAALKPLNKIECCDESKSLRGAVDEAPYTEGDVAYIMD